MPGWFYRIMRRRWGSARSIIGVGSAGRASAARWNIAQGTVVAWILTIPMSASIAAIAYWMARSFR